MNLLILYSQGLNNPWRMYLFWCCNEFGGKNWVVRNSMNNLWFVVVLFLYAHDFCLKTRRESYSRGLFFMVYI